MITVDEFQDNKIKDMVDDLFHGIGIQDANAHVIRDNNSCGKEWLIIIDDKLCSGIYGSIIVSKYLHYWYVTYYLMSEEIKKQIDINGIQNYVRNYIDKNII